MYSPVVSVVMPVYNGERTLATAISSVLSQSMPELELIVCNDASIDGTATILEAITDPRLRVLTNERNIGPGLSRDRAITVASAPWIAFIDADDAWQPDRLKRLLGALDGSENRILFDDIMVCHDRDGQMVPWRRLRGPAAFGAAGGWVDVALEEYLVQERLLIKPLLSTDIIKGHGIRHSNRAFGEDAEFFIRLAAVCDGFRYVPEPGYLYRVTPNSATAQASDPTLMRSCLEECADSVEWADEVVQAFNRKIKALEINEVLYHVHRRVKEGRFSAAIRLVLSTPSVAPLLCKRVLRQLRYQLHRVVRGGSRR